MGSKEYWEKREAENLKHCITEEKEFDKQLHRIYEDMLDKVQKEIDAFYGKYATKEGITIAEAKKRVSKLDIKAYERKAKRYVKEREFSAEANEEMRLYNLTMKVNRLEMLKANIGLELIAGHDEVQKFMEGILQGRTEDELKRQAGFLGKSVTNNAKAARTIVNASFHNATFSNRIWMHQDLLKAEVGKLLQNGLIQGRNPRVLAKDIEKKFNVSRHNAERLMRTELARVQTEAQKESFIRNGFSMYTFHTNTGCCDICAALNGKHFKIKDMAYGDNAPPVHPHCRCSTSAYEDSEEYNEWLDYVSNGGTTEEWNKMRAKSTKNDIAKSSKGSTIELGRKVGNTGAFASLPEKMSKKHIRELAKEYGIDLEGITINIDTNEELLRINYAGRADHEKVGGITFFPNAFRSKEELLRTIYHERLHVEQFKEHGVTHVQDNRAKFENLAYEEEDAFIDKLKKEGVL